MENRQRMAIMFFERMLNCLCVSGTITYQDEEILIALCDDFPKEEADRLKKYIQDRAQTGEDSRRTSCAERRLLTHSELWERFRHLIVDKGCL